MWGCGYFSQIMTIFRAELNVFHWVEVMNDGKRRALGRMLICSGLRADITLKLLFSIILFLLLSFFIAFIWEVVSTTFTFLSAQRIVCGGLTLVRGLTRPVAERTDAAPRPRRKRLRSNFSASRS